MSDYIDKAEDTQEETTPEVPADVPQHMGVTPTPKDVPTDDVTQLPKYWLPEGVYQGCKWAAAVALPLVGVVYTTLATVWPLPAAPQVAVTAQVAALALGVLIGASQLTKQ